MNLSISPTASRLWASLKAGQPVNVGRFFLQHEGLRHQPPEDSNVIHIKSGWLETPY
jgi:hypothetical protein